MVAGFILIKISSESFSIAAEMVIRTVKIVLFVRTKFV